MSAFICFLCTAAAGALYRLAIGLFGRMKKLTRPTLIALDVIISFVMIGAAAAACFLLFDGSIPYYAPLSFIFGFVCVAIFF